MSNNMSLSAYVYGFNQPTNNTPTPPQPGINSILPPDLEGTITDQTHVELLDFVERDVDIIEGDDF